MAIDAVTGKKSWAKNAYILHFGTYGDCTILAYADSLEDALEDAAQEIANRGWLGLFTEPDYGDAFEDLQRDGEIPSDLSWENLQDNFYRPDLSTYAEKVREYAEADLTYTEAGWIASWEWAIAYEGPARSSRTKAAILQEGHGYGFSSGCVLHGYVYADGSVWRGPTEHNHPMAKRRVRA